MTTEQKQNTPATKWEVERLVKASQYKQNQINQELQNQCDNIPSQSTINSIVEGKISDYMEDYQPSVEISGVTVSGKKVIVGNPNNYTSNYYDCINIGSNSANTFNSNNIVVGYGLSTWGGNVNSVNIFGKWNTTNGWDSSTYPVLAIGTGSSSSGETALAYFNKNGNSKWYLKGIGYDDTCGFTANGNQDLKSYIDEGANLIAPDDVVDYFVLPLIKVNIVIDSTGNTIITSTKQCETLPIDEDSKYYIGSTKYMFSGVTPTWVNNNDGTFTYTLPASITHPENYKGNEQYIAINPTNFYVEGGVTYRVLYNAVNEFDGHTLVYNNKTNSKILARKHSGNGGNRHKPQGMVYNPNCADWYELTAGQLSRILANS